MRLYTVHHRPDGANLPEDPDVVLVKEGFCWPALFLPILWLLYRKQFWGLLAFLTLFAVSSAAVALVGMNELAATLISLVLSLLVAAQANDWRRWRLDAAGYRLVGVVAGGNLSDAEEVFFHDLWPRLSTEEAAPPAPVHRPLPASRLTPFATPFDPV